MPTTALTFTDATFTARTVGDSPEGLERFGGGTNYENAILAADLKSFPSGGVATTNSFNDFRQIVNQLADDVQHEFGNLHLQVVDNNNDLAEFVTFTNETTTKMGQIKVDLESRASETIALTAGTGLSGGGNLTADRTFSLDVATDSAIGGVLEGGDIDISGTGVMTIKANAVALGTDTTGQYVSTVTAGTGITATSTEADDETAQTISITDTITARSTFLGNVGTGGQKTITVPRLKYNAQGQLTSTSTASGVSANNSTITITAGDGLELGTGDSSFTTNSSTAKTIKFQHTDTSSQATDTATQSGDLTTSSGSTFSDVVYDDDNSTLSYFDKISLDTYGHVTSLRKRSITYGMSSIGRMTTTYSGDHFDLHIPRESDFVALRKTVNTLSGSTVTIPDAGAVAIDRALNVTGGDVTISGGSNLVLNNLKFNHSNQVLGISATGVTPPENLILSGTGIRVQGTDTKPAQIEALTSSQGSARLYFGQSSSYGFGLQYVGQATGNSMPSNSFAGGSDASVFFARSGLSLSDSTTSTESLYNPSGTIKTVGGKAEVPVWQVNHSQNRMFFYGDITGKRNLILGGENTFTYGATANATLDVRGDTKISAVYVTKGNSGSGLKTIGGSVNGIANAWLNIGDGLGFDPNEIWAENNLYIGVKAGSEFHIRESDATRLYIEPTSGNVGIKTTSPTKALDVNGSARIASNLTVDGETDIGTNLTIGTTYGTDGIIKYNEQQVADSQPYNKFSQRIKHTGTSTPAGGSASDTAYYKIMEFDTDFTDQYAELELHMGNDYGQTSGAGIGGVDLVFHRRNTTNKFRHVLKGDITPDVNDEVYFAVYQESDKICIYVVCVDYAQTLIDGLYWKQGTASKVVETTSPGIAVGNVGGSLIYSTSRSSGDEPNWELDVGTLTVRDTLNLNSATINGLTVTDDVTIQTNQTIAGDLKVGTNDLFVDDSQSNVGIGTITPDSNYKLEVAGSQKITNGTLQVQTGTTGNDMKIILSEKGTNQQSIEFFEASQAFFDIFHDGSETSPNNKLKFRVNTSGSGGIDTEVMTFAQSGNVSINSGKLGIGTSTPDSNAAMHIKKGAPRLLLDGTSASSENDEISRVSGVWDGTYVGDIRFLAGDDTTNKDNGKIEFRTYTSAGVTDTRMIIDETGKVGIGTDAPTKNLEVIGSFKVKHDTDDVRDSVLIESGKVKIFETSSVSDPQQLMVGRIENEHIQIGVNDQNNIIKAVNDLDSNGAHYFTLNRDFTASTGASDFQIQNNGSNQLVIDKNGIVNINGTTPKLGIGIDVPTTALEVIGDIKIKQGSGYTNYALIDASEAKLTFETNSTDTSAHPADIIFKPNEVEKMRIADSGNVGIGTTTPSGLLHLKGNFEEPDGDGNKALVIESTRTSGATHYFRTHGNDGQNLNIYANSVRALDLHSALVKSYVSFEAPNLTATGTTVFGDSAADTHTFKGDITLENGNESNSSLAANKLVLKRNDGQFITIQPDAGGGSGVRYTQTSAVNNAKPMTFDNKTPSNVKPTGGFNSMLFNIRGRRVLTLGVNDKDTKGCVRIGQDNPSNNFSLVIDDVSENNGLLVKSNSVHLQLRKTNSTQLAQLFSNDTNTVLESYKDAGSNKTNNLVLRQGTQDKLLISNEEIEINANTTGASTERVYGSKIKMYNGRHDAASIRGGMYLNANHLQIRLDDGRRSNEGNIPVLDGAETGGDHVAIEVSRITNYKISSHTSTGAANDDDTNNNTKDSWRPHTTINSGLTVGRSVAGGDAYGLDDLQLVTRAPGIRFLDVDDGGDTDASNDKSDIRVGLNDNTLEFLWDVTGIGNNEAGTANPNADLYDSPTGVNGGLYYDGSNSPSINVQKGHKSSDYFTQNAFSITAPSSAGEISTVKVGSDQSTNKATLDVYGRAYTPSYAVTLSAGTNTIDLKYSNTYIISMPSSLGSRPTIDLTANSYPSGSTFTFLIKNESSYEIDFADKFYFAGGDPAITTGSSGTPSIDILSFVSDGTNLYTTIAQNLKTATGT